MANPNKGGLKGYNGHPSTPARMASGQQSRLTDDPRSERTIYGKDRSRRRHKGHWTHWMNKEVRRGEWNNNGVPMVKFRNTIGGF